VVGFEIGCHEAIITVMNIFFNPCENSFMKQKENNAKKLARL